VSKATRGVWHNLQFCDVHVTPFFLTVHNACRHVIANTQSGLAILISSLLW
jgi:hypothetical protein